MKTISSLAILLVAAAIGVVVPVFMKKGMPSVKPVSTEQLLANAAKEINKNSPSQVDANTILINAVAIGTTLRYRLTLANITSSEFVKNSINELNGEKMKNNVCSTEGMKPFIEIKAILEYAYYDKDGVELEVVAIDTSKCA